MELIDILMWAEDPLNQCGGQPVIMASSIDTLAQDLAEFPSVIYSEEQINLKLRNETKRFSACGANNSERFGVLRKNPETGWQYIIDLITK